MRITVHWGPFEEEAADLTDAELETRLQDVVREALIHGFDGLNYRHGMQATYTCPACGKPDCVLGTDATNWNECSPCAVLFSEHAGCRAVIITALHDATDLSPWGFVGGWSPGYQPPFQPEARVIDARAGEVEVDVAHIVGVIAADVLGFRLRRATPNAATPEEWAAAQVLVDDLDWIRGDAASAERNPMFDHAPFPEEEAEGSKQSEEESEEVRRNQRGLPWVFDARWMLPVDSVDLRRPVVPYPPWFIQNLGDGCESDAVVLEMRPGQPRIWLQWQGD